MIKPAHFRPEIARPCLRAVEALNRPVEVISCYEADGFWLHRVLEAHGVRNYVIDPASLQVDRRARRVKTDNIDLGRLLRSLMAYLRSGRKCGALCVYQVSPRKMTVGCIASVIA